MISPLPPGGHKIRCGRVMVLPLVPIAAATPQTWHLTPLEPAPFEQTEICQEIVTLPCGVTCMELSVPARGWFDSLRRPQQAGEPTQGEPTQGGHNL